MPLIYKIGAIVIDKGKILVGKKRDRYIIPGGRIEQGESAEECLRRELKEEFGVSIISQEYFGTFEDDAALDPGMRIKMDVYMVKIEGAPRASEEIEEALYIDTKIAKSIRLGSILEKFVIPQLAKRGLID